MNRQSSTQRHKQRKNGFVLPMVLFLIVVLAGAAVAISQLTVDNTASNIQALQKTRADLFNQSIVDLAVHELVTGKIVDGENCESEGNHTHPDFPGLEAELECKPANYTTATTGDFVLWTITVTTESAGLAPSDEEYIWRRINSVVEI